MLDKVYKAARKVIPNGELFLVGGCVRDILLNKIPKDYDFTTNLSPEEVRDLFKLNGRKVWESGIRFGTIGSKVLVDNKYVPIEITTYRTEKYQNKCRKPEVEFSNSLEEDLKRRDFTINSMAYGSKNNTNPILIDLFNGKKDLENKIIKSVNDIEKMIKDDPLRILRAIRFSSQLDFIIENNLFNSLKEYVYLLKDVAIERQEVELSKMLMNNFGKSLYLLNEIDYIKLFLPEILINDKLKVFLKDKSFENEDLMWKYLLSNSGELLVEDDKYLTNSYQWRTKFINQGICKRFKFSNKRTKIILED